MGTQGGLGVVLKIDDSGLTAVANLLDAGFPEQEKTLWEYLLHDSTDGYMQQMDTGARKLTEFTALLLWDDTESTHAAILTAFDATTPTSFSIEDPAGQETLTFDAFVQKIGRISKTDEGYQAEVTITPTGAPTIT